MKNFLNKSVISFFEEKNSLKINYCWNIFMSKYNLQIIDLENWLLFINKRQNGWECLWEI